MLPGIEPVRKTDKTRGRDSTTELGGIASLGFSAVTYYLTVERKFCILPPQEPPPPPFPLLLLLLHVCGLTLFLFTIIGEVILIATQAELKLHNFSKVLGG